MSSPSLSSKMLCFSLIVLYSFTSVTNIPLESETRNRVARKDKCEKKNPIVLIPGLMGSRLYGQVNITEEISSYCQRNMSYHRVWINTMHALNFGCFSKMFSLRYNAEKNTMDDQEGVNINADYFGDLKTISVLDSSFFGSYFSTYFQPVITFITNMGWSYNVNIKAAPYDFRKMPLRETKEEYFRKLGQMVEELHTKDECKVVLISHSMGSPLARMFLAEKGQAWINKHVRAWISLNGAFAGAKTSVISRTFGLSSWDIAAFLKSYLQIFFSTFPSLYFLQPSKSYFGEDLPIAFTSSQNFTLKNMTDFQRVIIGDNQQKMENLNIPDIYPNTTFNVRFLCIYSTGHPTITGVKLNDNYTLNDDNLILGTGDGTVSTEELKSCEAVAKSIKKRKTRIVHLPGLDHMGILSSGRTLGIIEKFLTRLKSRSGIKASSKP